MGLSLMSLARMKCLIGFHKVLLGFTGFYWVLLGFTGFYFFFGVLLDFTGFFYLVYMVKSQFY